MSSKKSVILICDDDELFHLSMKRLLSGTYEVLMAKSPDEASAILRNRSIDVLLLDISMRTEREGLESLPKLKQIDPSLTVVMSSGHTDFTFVREAMQKGADDYLPKGSTADEVWATLERVFKNRRQCLDLNSQKKENISNHKRYQLVGRSKKMTELRGMIERLRGKDVPVMIYGETGTGKEVIARQLRAESSDGSLLPFIAVDCSTISGTIAESILFGHEKGAFTGADQMRKGVFEEANGGLVFLDEIGNMSLDIQAKFLRVLQEKEVTRVGSAKAIPLNFRVICASNKKLEDLVKLKLFKDDLFQRLNVIPLELPPLRDRKEDIPDLVNYFLEQGGMSEKYFTEEALEILKTYPWPGNIRELQNVVSYVTTLIDSDELDGVSLPPHIRDQVPSLTTTLESVDSNGSFYDQVGMVESQILKKAYEKHQGQISKMATDLKMDRSHLYTKLKQHGILVVSNSRISK